ncbi:hypothetical protein CF15_00565 [Pyrodictium occultum]|uniref:Lon proteolytic domain-containing protein n=1 Tax=Pyrodictium occultum TaxID=2309 RepID=A0A0V8RTJ4_PYROC|nr:S16 family serine protease [Pyrodictium occultum]KSW11393.1 hypothetical protein CF15_00565 [Pyrodictium occultum]
MTPGRPLVLLSLLFLTMATIVAPVAGSTAPGYKWINTVVVNVPGVVETPEGYKGAMSRLIVTVAWPGSGIVYFSANPLTELDTQAAARMAALVASILAGVNYYSYDYFIRLESNATTIGGPSASGAMTVAIIAALRGKRIPENFSMTGMVDPDATLGPVGGVPEKLEAAAKAGVKVFVIPAGQRYSIDLNTGDRVDVVALGRQLGVKVVEAGTIAEAYEAATGDKLYTPKQLNLNYPAWLAESLKRSIEVYREAASTNLTCAEELLAKLPGSIADQLHGIIDDAGHSVNVGRSLDAAGKLYAAASRYFAAAIEATYACGIAKAFSSDQPATTIIEEARSYIDAASAMLGDAYKLMHRFLEGKRDISDVELQLLTASASRLSDANESLEEAASLLKTASKSSGLAAASILDKALQEAIYSYYRSMTASQWLELALAAPSGKPINIDTLPRVVDTYTYFAESALSYLQTLGVDVSDVAERVAEAKQLAAQAAETGDRVQLLQALAYSVQGLAQVDGKLHQVFNTGISVLDASRKSLDILVEKLLGLGLTPLLPMMYREYAETLVDVGGKLDLYVQASSYALLLAIIGGSRTGAKPPAAAGATTGGVGGAATTVTITHTVTAKETVTVTKPKYYTRTTVSTTTLTKTLEKTTTLTIKSTTAGVAANNTPTRRGAGLGTPAACVAFAGIALALGALLGRVLRG